MTTMKSLLIFSILFILALPVSAQDRTKFTVVEKGNVLYSDFKDDYYILYEDYFTTKTMRVDYYHSGTSKEEHFAFDRAVSDGPWAGSETILRDKLELGLYFFEIQDKASGRIIYSRGFASVFGEWQTIPDAEVEWGTFHESIRFPWPKRTINIIMKKRDGKNQFQEIWRTELNPSSRKVNPADIKPTHKVNVIADSGPPTITVDIVILGDGYSKSEMEKFAGDAKRLAEVLLNNEPFKWNRNEISIRAIETPAEESGVHKPHPGVFRRTPLSANYGSFDSERYVLSYDNKTLRDIASEVPYDFMVILVNERTYGGGGIFNLYTTVSADNKFADYIMVHEFGHHMAGLADEYYTSSVSYEAPGIEVEPWETNITALKDKNTLKWKKLVDPKTPLPTPWNKAEFDQFGYQIQKQRDSLRAAKVPEPVMEDLFLRQRNQEDKWFAQEKYKDQVGAFEGAGYMQYGLYRSQLDCIMYTRHMNFCKVCANSLQAVINMYIR